MGASAILALAAGCAAFQGDHEPTDDVSPVVMVPIEMPPPDETANFPRPPERPTRAPEPKPVQAVSPFPTLSDPGDLIGKSEAEVYVLLGPASGRREEAPATVLEYQTGSCSLDLFLYMDMENRTFRTLAYDIRSLDQRPNGHCIAVIQGGRGE